LCRITETGVDPVISQKLAQLFVRELITHEDRETREQLRSVLLTVAATHLGRRLTDMLVPQLSSRNRQFRWRAWELAAELPEAAITEGLLRRCAAGGSHRDEQEPTTAAAILARFGKSPQREQALTKLIELAHDTDGNNPLEAVRFLLEFGREREKQGALSALRKQMREGFFAAVYQAAGMLAAQGTLKDRQEAVAELFRRFRNDIPDLAAAAAHELVALGARVDPLELTTALCQFTSSSDDYARARAIEIWEALLSSQPEQVDLSSIRKALGDSSAEVRAGAARLMVRFGTDSEKAEALTQLRADLNSGEWSTCLLAARVLLALENSPEREEIGRVLAGRRLPIESSLFEQWFDVAERLTETAWNHPGLIRSLINDLKSDLQSASRAVRALAKLLLAKPSRSEVSHPTTTELARRAVALYEQASAGLARIRKIKGEKITFNDEFVYTGPASHAIDAMRHLAILTYR
jgi:hypothetical protein